MKTSTCSGATYVDWGRDQRFVVTNLVRKPRFIYEDLYMLRGDVENRTKELKLDLEADCLSCHRFLVNQFRLLLHTAAYRRPWLLRRHLTGTELATAQVHTLRLKLLKIGARIRETSRRIWVHLASGYPYRSWPSSCKTCWPTTLNRLPPAMVLDPGGEVRPKSTLGPPPEAFFFGK